MHNLSHTLNDELYVLPFTLQVVSTFICIIIIVFGISGNILTMAVLIQGRNGISTSTNIFLMNLSLADLSVLLICTPTILVEVTASPEIWVLGETMCKAVPFIEATVAHTSVLTILAISFERYYAICDPLRVNTFFTKSKAVIISFLTWFVAALLTSPFIFMVSFHVDHNENPVCQTTLDGLWNILYISTANIIFFIVPVIILVSLYTVIICKISQRLHIKSDQASRTYRRDNQRIIRMLCIVISIFFICALPLRAMMMWIVFSPLPEIVRFGIDRYYSVLYFSRIMFYLNSVLNPILYTFMSASFRKRLNFFLIDDQ